MIPGDFKAYALVLPTEMMYAFIDKNDTIINYDKSRYFTHRANTDSYLDGSVSSVSGNTANIYYRVKKGDNLSTIARRNGTTVSRLQSWNGLTSTKLSIGKQLIVGKKTLPPPKPELEAKPEPEAKPESEKNDYNRAETAGEENIISSYLKDQIEKVEQKKNADEFDEMESIPEVKEEHPMEPEEESEESTTSVE